MKNESRFLAVRPITDKRKFYLLSLTWGLPMNLAGCIIAGAMLISGHRMRRFGPCFFFEHGRNWGGLSWGMFIVVNEGAGNGLLSHELGHAMQNCKFGFFMPLLVGLPSSFRYWTRRIRTRIFKRPPKTDYDAVWFEAQASAVGQAYMQMTAGK